MFRLLLRPILLLTLLAALPIALIRAQPNNAAQLRAFLTSPDGCPAPCFMGIRPGVTTVDEAIAILENHEWVKSISEPTQEYGEYKYWSIQWSGRQPEWINTANSAILTQYSDNSIGAISITLNTNQMIGDLYLSLGNPPAYFATGRDFVGGGSLNFVTHIYSNSSLTFETTHPCPLKFNYFLQTRIDRINWSILWQDYQPTLPVQWQQMLSALPCY